MVLMRSHYTRRNTLPGTTLTGREKEILLLLSQGRNTKEIASMLYIAIKTMETHRANILYKLESHSTIQAVLKAVKRNIIPCPYCVKENNHEL